MFSDEIEAKFLLEDPAQSRTLVDSLESLQLSVIPRAAVELVDRYLDTADWQILQAGWAYRCRDASGKREVGLKSVASSKDVIQRRIEVTQRVDVFPTRGRCVREGKIADTLGDVSQAKLRELFQVHNQRQLFEIRSNDGALIELAIDHVTVTATSPKGKRVRGRLEFDELELELKAGGQDSLRQLAARIGEIVGLLPARMSKFERGLQCAGLVPPAHARPATRMLEQPKVVRKLHSQRLRKRDPVNALAYRYLLEQFEQMLHHEPGAWEGLEAEGVHQMRVAIRRIRAALRVFKRVLPTESIKSFRDEFRWVAAELGTVRDLDVFQDKLQTYIATIPAEHAERLTTYQDHLVEQRRLARAALLECFTNRRYQQLKDDFTQFLQQGACKTASRWPRGRTIGESASRSIGKQYRKLIRDGRAIHADSPDKALHALRIDCKRMRYLLEFFQPTYGKQLNGMIRQMTKLQDVLGDFQDACVAMRRLRQYSVCVPMQIQNSAELLAIGELIDLHQRLASDARGAFRSVWKRFDRKRRRRQLSDVLK